VWWRDVEKVGTNPKTGEQVVASRRKLWREVVLPMRDEYDAFIRQRVAEAISGVS